ncbi:MAG: MOSC domain-containing protein [Candidatus Nanopelagicales bacterium]
MDPRTMHLSALWVYPLKSCAGVAVDRWPLDADGLRYDRSWMVVDPDGEFLTQREEPRLALARPRWSGDGWDVDVAGEDRFQLPLRVSGPTVPATVWGHTGPAVDAGDLPAAALSRLLDRPVRLVGLADDHDRRADPGYGADEAPVGFSDGFPLLVSTDASLADLNRRLPTPLPMRRFRPNLVISGSSPWAEDDWRRVVVGAATLDVVKPCSRCTITTVDPDRGVRDGGEPLRTLGTFRRGERGVIFGQNAVPRSTATVAVGDPVTVG